MIDRWMDGRIKLKGGIEMEIEIRDSIILQLFVVSLDL